MKFWHGALELPPMETLRHRTWGYGSKDHVLCFRSSSTREVKHVSWNWRSFKHLLCWFANKRKTIDFFLSDILKWHLNEIRAEQSSLATVPTWDSRAIWHDILTLLNSKSSYWENKRHPFHTCRQCILDMWPAKLYWGLEHVACWPPERFSKFYIACWRSRLAFQATEIPQDILRRASSRE